MRLLCHRTDTTHAVLGLLFALDDRTAGRNRSPLQPPLAGVFRIPERRVELAPDESRENRRRTHTRVMKNVAGLHTRMFG